MLRASSFARQDVGFRLRASGFVFWASYFMFRVSEFGIDLEAEAAHVDRGEILSKQHAKIQQLEPLPGALNISLQGVDVQGDLEAQAALSVFGFQALGFRLWASGFGNQASGFRL